MKRVIGILAAILVVAIGGGYYFFKIYRPKVIQRDAQAEIVAWEARWTAARTCLLGPAPGSAKTSEALAIRELSPDPWDRSSCTPLISKLARGEATLTGITSVDDAWNELDRAAGRAAEAFATHVAEAHMNREAPWTEGRAEPGARDPLPAALDALDAARMTLRASADLPVEANSGKALPAAQLIPIADGAEALEQLDPDRLPSAHGAVFDGHTANRIVQITLVAGGTPKVARLGPGAVRAVPDGSWGATPSPDGPRVGAMDGEGAMAAPQPVDPMAAAVLKTAAVGAAIGTLASGVVIYGADNQLAISHRDGDHVVSILRKAVIETYGTDADGRAAVAWYDDKAAHAQILRPGLVDKGGIQVPADEDIIDLGLRAPLSQPCLSATRAWVALPDQIVGFGAGKPLVTGQTTGVVIGCAPDGAIVREGSLPQKLVLCTDTACRPTALPTGAPELSSVTLVGGKLVAIGEHGGVIGVWQEDGTKTFYALPQPARPVLANAWPVMAMTDGKVIDVLVRVGKGYAIVRVPVTGRS